MSLRGFNVDRHSTIKKLVIMKAVIANKKSIENIEIRDISIPKIQQNEVLIKIKAIGVNPVDWKGL